MSVTSLQFKLGSISSHYGEFRFTFIVYNNGNAHLEIYAFNPTDLRKASVFLQLAESGYQTLKQLIADTEEMIEKLKLSGQWLKTQVLLSTQDISMEADIGLLETYGGGLFFGVTLRNDGIGNIQLFAADIDDRRKSGVIVRCDEQLFKELKQIISKTDDLIAKLSDSNQMKQLSIAS